MGDGTMLAGHCLQGQVREPEETAVTEGDLESAQRQDTQGLTP